MLIILFNAWLIGKDIYFRQNPVVIGYEEALPFHPTNKISYDNIFFGFFLSDTLNNVFEDDQILKIIPLIYTNYYDKNGTFKYRERFLELTDCRSEFKRLNISEPLNEAIFEPLKCIKNFNEYLSGFWTETHISYLMFKAIKCKNESITENSNLETKEEIMEYDKFEYKIKDINLFSPNAKDLYSISNTEIIPKESNINIGKNNVVCKTNEEIKKVIPTLFFNFFYTSILINSKNFTNPMIPKINEEWFNLGTSIFKTIDYFFQNVIIRTDDGLIFSKDYEDTIRLGYYKHLADYRSLDDTDPNIFWLNIYVSDKVKYVTREYLKIQNIFANLGGIIQIVLIIFKLTFSPFLQKKMNLKIINELFDFDDFVKQEVSDNKVVRRIGISRIDSLFVDKNNINKKRKSACNLKSNCDSNIKEVSKNDYFNRILSNSKYENERKILQKKNENNSIINNKQINSNNEIYAKVKNHNYYKSIKKDSDIRNLPNTHLNADEVLNNLNRNIKNKSYELSKYEKRGKISENKNNCNNKFLEVDNSNNKFSRTKFNYDSCDDNSFKSYSENPDFYNPRNLKDLSSDIASPVIKNKENICSLEKLKNLKDDLSINGKGQILSNCSINGKKSQFDDKNIPNLKNTKECFKSPKLINDVSPLNEKNNLIKDCDESKNDSNQKMITCINLNQNKKDLAILNDENNPISKNISNNNLTNNINNNLFYISTKNTYKKRRYLLSKTPEGIDFERKIDEVINIKERKLNFKNMEILNSFYCCYLLCRSKNLKDKNIIYNYSYKNLNQYTDYLQSIKNFQDLTKLKYILLSTEQILSFQFLSNPSKMEFGIHHDIQEYARAFDEKVYKRETAIEIFNYFHKKIQDDNLSDFDKKIWNIFDKKMKNLFINTSNELTSNKKN